MIDSVKNTAKSMRDSLQQGIYVVINPFVRFLLRLGFTPNIITFIGFLGNVAAALVIGWGAYSSQGGTLDWKCLTWGGGLIIGFSLFDMLDGQAARLGGLASTFGAFFDSVLDRYCEFVTVGAVTYMFLCQGWNIAALLTFLALMGSLLVSYARARGEGLGVVCKIGFMQRPERVVLTALSLLASGICGQAGVTSFDPLWIVAVAMGVMALFTNLTAIARIQYMKKHLH
ncbi:MAG: CDP-alcohol phosphatidyltransferase family protein [Muribaculaceae bacterium]|nr:CDP-alcohol phosphatidyltransferase family protein [Muribaculaceae bacterium]MDE6787675.1 CDP-alcohol phosphatidyltransferase family protein [Muribaculaceae bacterium]